MTKNPKVLERKEVFRLDYIGVEAIKLLLKNGREKIIPSALYPDVTVVVPMLDNKTVLMTKEYRPSINKTFLTVPGGKSKPGESMEDSARRECLEEAGYKCSTLKKLITYYPLIGLTTAQIHIFVASGLKPAKQHLDIDEAIKPVKVKLKDVPKLIERGKIAESKSIIGLTLLLNKSV